MQWVMPVVELKVKLYDTRATSLVRLDAEDTATAVGVMPVVIESRRLPVMIDSRATRWAQE